MWLSSPNKHETNDYLTHYYTSFLNVGDDNDNHIHAIWSKQDGKHTVYGRVLDEDSMLTVRKCEAVPVNGTTPRIPLKITQCGEL
jgi:hypothetical protein